MAQLPLHQQLQAQSRSCLMRRQPLRLSWPVGHLEALRYVGLTSWKWFCMEGNEISTAVAPLLKLQVWGYRRIWETKPPSEVPRDIDTYLE